METTRQYSKKTFWICMGVLIVALIGIGVNIYFAFFKDDSSLQSTGDGSLQSSSHNSTSQNTGDSTSQSTNGSTSQNGNYSSYSYLQMPDQIYIMEAGILHNHLKFRDGESHEFTYDFTNDEYAELKSKYRIESIAGSGTELEKALRLTNEFAPRLTHKSNYDNHIQMNAMALLEYSLDNTRQGINCRAKAQILNEMCLALNLYARKVWILPNSEYDNDCHVVNEIWDSTLNKWVMLDITSNTYWVDETRTPLSILEIRHKGAMQGFCTPVVIGNEYELDNLQKTKEKNIGTFLYIMKNMVYMQYCSDYTLGESNPRLTLAPENLDLENSEGNRNFLNKEFLISQSSIEQSPIQ